jgi:tetratricopeptide (TPR) repeat protein
MNFRTYFIAISALAAVLVSQPCFAANPPLDQARDLAKNGRWADVQALAAQGAELEPKNDEAWRLRGRAELFLGDTTAAIQFLEKAVELNPKQPDAVVDLTTLYVAMDKVADADRVVAAAEKKDPKGKIDEIKVSRALILGKQNKIAEATPILASATAKHPENPLYPLMLARIYNNAKVTALAKDNYAKAWSLNEGNPDIAFEYGQTLLDLKEYDEADRLFKVVQEKDPSNTQVDYLRGRLRYAAGRFAEASAEFAKAVEKTPDDFLPNYWLGRSYVDLSKSEKKNFYGAAIAPLRKALELRPDRADISLSLAEAEYYVGRSTFYLASSDSISQESRTSMAEEFEDQAADYSAHAKTDNDPALAALKMELAARYKSAAEAMRGPESKLDDKSPLRRELLSLSVISMEHAIADNNEITKTQDAYANIARAFDKLAQLDSALYYTERQLEVTPNSASDITRKVSLLQRMDDQARLVEYLSSMMSDTSLLDKYGLIVVNACIETKQYEKAVEYSNTYLVRHPGDCDAHMLKSYIYLKRELYTQAIPVLEQGVRACPKNTSMWVYLGDSYYFSNENDKPTVQKAKDAYCKACNLGNSTGCEKCEQIGEILKQMRR